MTSGAGTATAAASRRWRRAALVVACLALLLTLSVVVVRLLPHAPLGEQVSSSRAVYARGGELLRITLAPDEQYRMWVPLERISPTLIDAVLLYEDRSFYHHPGVNPAALVRSAWHVASGGRRHLQHDLIGLDLDQDFVDGDSLAGLLFPGQHGGFGHGFGQLRNFDFYDSHLNSFGKGVLFWIRVAGLTWSVQNP